MTKWWLSFAGEEGFRGVVVVEAPDFIAAAARSRQLGCNPGGQCRGWPLPPEAEGEYPLDRLISKAELHALGEMTEKEWNAKGRVLAVPGEVLCDNHSGGSD